MQYQELFDFALKSNSSRTIFTYWNMQVYIIILLILKIILHIQFSNQKGCLPMPFLSLLMGRKILKNYLQHANKLFAIIFAMIWFPMCWIQLQKIIKNNQSLFNLIPIISYIIGYYLTANQFEKLCMYSQIAKFESKEYFSFISHLFNHFSNDQTIIFHTSIIRRMITVFIRIYSKSN